MKCKDCRFCEQVTGDYHSGVCKIRLPQFMGLSFLRRDKRVYSETECSLGQPYDTPKIDFEGAAKAAGEYLDDNPNLLSEVGEMLDKADPAYDYQKPDNRSFGTSSGNMEQKSND